MCVGRRDRDLATERREVPGLALDDPRLCRGQWGGGSGRPPGGLKRLWEAERALPSSPAASLVFQAVPVYPLTAGAAACALKLGPRPVPRVPWWLVPTLSGTAPPPTLP